MLDNGFVHVEVDADDGTCTIDADGVRVEGANRYVDGGDGGDTYNYSPPAVDTVVDRPASCRRRGPRAGTGPGAAARHRRTTRWPARADRRRARVQPRAATTGRRDGRAPPTSCAPASAFLRVRVELDNTAPRPPPARALPAPRAGRRVRRRVRVRGRAPRAHRRGRSPRARPPHVRVPPLRRLLRRRDAASRSLHDGLLEYEVVDDGTELALTLLRATGYLSRSEPAFRPEPGRARSTPLDGPAAAGHAARSTTPCSPTGRLAAPPACPEAADDFLVPLEGTSVPTRTGPVRRRASRRPPIGPRSRSGARTSVPLQRDASRRPHVRAGQPLSEADATVDAHLGRRRTRGTPCRPRRRRGRARGRPRLRPWEILTLRSAPLTPTCSPRPVRPSSRA